MLIVNDYAFHPCTGKSGRVIGYGSKMMNDCYLPTLKVLVNDQTGLNKTHRVMEDLVSRWMPIK